MSDDIRKIQDLLNLAEQELARNKLEARLVLTKLLSLKVKVRS